ncbi:MAG: vWA domain-containing protein [Gemmataceae bacterium]
MSFLYPPVLLLLAVPAGLLVWTWRRHGQEVVLPFDHGGRGRGVLWRLLLDSAESLPALLLAVAIVVLAGPQRQGVPAEKRRMTNIELCLDISGSMTAEFGDGTRYDGAMKAVEEFIDFRKGDAVGLTFFGHSVLHWAPLTTDPSAIKCAPPFMRPENVPPWFGGTAIGKALRACRQVLADRQDGERMIVLVSDGDSFDLYGAADEIAKEMKAANITVFAVLIGVSRIQDEIFTITETTGGEAFEAGDPDALKTMFKRIDQMKRAPVEKKLTDTLDDFWPWCVAGLAVAGVLVLAALGVRYTPW